MKFKKRNLNLTILILYIILDLMNLHLIIMKKLYKNVQL